jgi:hypothetical protein
VSQLGETRAGVERSRGAARRRAAETSMIITGIR